MVAMRPNTVADAIWNASVPPAPLNRLSAVLLASSTRAVGGIVTVPPFVATPARDSVVAGAMSSWPPAPMVSADSMRAGRLRA